MKIKRFPLGTLWTNCYVLSEETGNAVVVDPGGPAEDVLAYLDSEKLALQWILLTHGHGDHIMGIGDLRARSAHGVAIGEDDAECLTDANANLSTHMGGETCFEQADRRLKDGDVLEVGGLRIEVLHTPGHTRGGLCYYVHEQEDALLISGDTLFARSVGRSDLPGGDESILIDSLRKLAALPDSLRVYPGHGPDTTIGEERALNPFWPR